MELYNIASRDERVGMDGTLISTLRPSDAKAVIELYRVHLPTAEDRREMFELLTVLDRVATKTRRDTEDFERQKLMNQQKAEQERNKGRRRGR